MGRNANTVYKVEIDSTPSTSETYVVVGGITDLEWDNSEEIQENFFLEDDGAGSSDITGGRLNISVSGKRVDGDAGQDYIVGLVGSYGSARKSTVKLTNSQTGDVYTIPCSIEVGRFSGGSTVELEVFECTFHSDGAWTVSA